MSVYGIGIDLVEIDRIQKILDNDVQFHFRKKVFEDEEINYCEKFVKKAEHYGARFAAKEAFVKAIPFKDIGFREVAVRNDGQGKPFFEFGESLKRRLSSLGSLNYFLSLTHSRTTAGAVVVIEKIN